MAGCLNEVNLIGNVVKDPEIRRSQAGKPIANFSLATNETWRNADGERKERAEFHRIVIFNDGLCGVVEKYIRKGMKIFLRGALQTRRWTDQSGTEKYSTEIVLQGFNAQLVMLDGPKGRTDDVPEGNYGFGAGEPEEKRPPSRGNFEKKIDDEIPF